MTTRSAPGFLRAAGRSRTEPFSTAVTKSATVLVWIAMASAHKGEGRCARGHGHVGLVRRVRLAHGREGALDEDGDENAERVVLPSGPGLADAGRLSPGYRGRQDRDDRGRVRRVPHGVPGHGPCGCGPGGDIHVAHDLGPAVYLANRTVFVPEFTA